MDSMWWVVVIALALVVWGVISIRYLWIRRKADAEFLGNTHIPQADPNFGSTLAEQHLQSDYIDLRDKHAKLSIFASYIISRASRMAMESDEFIVEEYDAALADFLGIHVDFHLARSQLMDNYPNSEARAVEILLNGYIWQPNSDAAAGGS